MFGYMLMQSEVTQSDLESHLVQMEFPASNDEKYIFTSEVNVIPDYFPFEDCSGEECQGILK